MAASVYKPEKPAEIAMQPATFNNIVEANALIMEGCDEENACFTSLSTRRRIKPTIRPTANTPASPKLK